MARLGDNCLCSMRMCGLKKWDNDSDDDDVDGDDETAVMVIMSMLMIVTYKCTALCMN